MTSDDTSPPEPPVKTAGPGLLERVSVIWLLPLAALLAVLGVAWQSYAERGPLIEIGFENASGVKPGTTELRYRDVTVGLVEEVSFAPGLGHVLVKVRVDQEVAPYVDSEARFWVVRPQVTARGVSGLGTVLSGVYIEGLWDDEPGAMVERFDGLADAPLERVGQSGLHLVLRASGKSSLVEGAPILYRGIEVGRIGAPSITADGSTAQAEALIFAPHDRLINTATRFWDASGFSFSLGPSGANLDFSSVASLVSGGVTFDTMISGGAPAETGATYTVFPEEAAARESLFAGDDSETLMLSAVFEDNIAGLAVDAPVELNGLRIGRVTALNGLVDEERFGDSRVRLLTNLAIRPGRLGLDAEQGIDGAGRDAALALLRDRVGQGLRARLASASLLTGGLKIELVEQAGAEPAQIEPFGEDGLLLPTTDSEIADVSATAEGVFERINALPVEEVMAEAISLMQNTNRLIASDETRALPGNVNDLLGDARGVVGAPEIQALPGRLDGVLSDIQALVAQIAQEALAARLGATLSDASDAAQGVSDAVAGVPDLVAQLDAVAKKAEAVEIDAMAAKLTELIGTAETILAADETQALPGTLNSALEELSAVLAQLRDGGVVENATAALGSARDAADTFAAAGRDLPGLISEAEAVLTQARNTLAGYGAESGVGRDAKTALREVERAAKAVSSLARAIERNPNSLLLGR
ncbi:MlaD family protein [uncultured Roseovarius sp.]|uniref:PqiB family protein n=1 Tax=uncultured Roseovarius sp. TaxID=293344 RepID=UPI00261346F0|nr:MlaD family protein [uncultured Roseovarius sp.]